MGVFHTFCSTLKSEKKLTSKHLLYSIFPKVEEFGFAIELLNASKDGKQWRSQSDCSSLIKDFFFFFFLSENLKWFFMVVIVHLYLENDKSWHFLGFLHYQIKSHFIDVDRILDWQEMFLCQLTELLMQ